MKKLLFLISIALTGAVAAQTADSPIPSVRSNGDVGSEQIDVAIQNIEAREGLDDETRDLVISQLRDAQAQIGNRRAAESAAAAFAMALDAAPGEIRQLQEILAQQPPWDPTTASLGIRDDMLLSEIEQVLAREMADLAAAEADLEGLESQLADQADRPAVARQRINELRSIRDDLTNLIDATPPPAELAILTDARKLAAALRRDVGAAQIEQLEQEISSYGVRLDLMRARRDVAARGAVERRDRVDFLQQIVNSRRQISVAEAQADAIEAELAAADKHPAIKEIAEENAALTRELPSIAAEIERATSQLAETEREAQRIEQSLTRMRQRLEIGGARQAVGQLLLAERRDLPRFTQYRSDVRTRREALSTIGLARIRIEEKSTELAAFDEVVAQTMRNVSQDVSDEQRSSIRSEVVRLLEDRRELLDKAASTYRSYLRVLGDLDIAQERLVQSTDEFRDFLDRNLLWTPSTPIGDVNTVAYFGEALSWVFSPTRWMDSINALFQALRSRAAATIAALLLLSAVVLLRRPLKAQFRSISSKVGRLSTDHIGLTIRALAISAVIVLPLPLALALPGWALQHASMPTDFTVALSLALLAVAPFLYNLLLLRTICEEQGVARVHFGLQEQNLAITRRQLDKLILFGAPIVFIGVLAYESPSAAHRASLGGLAFVAFMVVFALVIRRLGDPRESVAQTYYDKRPESWVTRLKWVWFSIKTLGPIALALLAFAGYLYTALMLTDRIISTIWLVLGIVLVNLIVLRWLALARRKIEWQLALEKREARKAEQDSESEQGADSEIPVVEPKPLNLDTVDQQTRRLLKAGLLVVGVLFGWAIWSDLLPALQFLENVSLWSRSVTIDGMATPAPVTLADLLLALIVAGTTVIASRNLPGLMNIALLQRLNMDAGSRYTVNTLLRYAVVTIGVIGVFSIIGWNWSRIQWLVAALSVGLGFGLQEIVANFVSGLIILFERPVRVGDTVTVGELTGTVTKVRIRATTITDWDRKEIIVPNKNFITEQVINWTLTDPITRVIVPVGISYGSDVDLATRVMEETLHAMPLVLDEPAPRVYFLGFGDSSLDFRLYVYSRQLSDRLPLTHAVHNEILAALRENGIEIPFPQRDLYVKSLNLDGADPSQFGKSKGEQ
ncbi:MAG: mechanosensitive ion channel [Woeseiaceae bacterium]|nr:mechanosensitive ion channel [Woeseiaceae bacterium]